jgi:hypothetical protein
MPAGTSSNFGKKISDTRKSTDKGFDSEYLKLVEKVGQRGGRISVEEEKRLDKIRGIEKESQLEREKQFLERKAYKVEQQKMLAFDQEMEECSFEPDTKKSNKNSRYNQPRDLYNFLSDQQRHLENKNMKIM